MRFNFPMYERHAMPRHAMCVCVCVFVALVVWVDICVVRAIVPFTFHLQSRRRCGKIEWWTKCSGESRTCVTMTMTDDDDANNNKWQPRWKLSNALILNLSCFLVNDRALITLGHSCRLVACKCSSNWTSSMNNYRWPSANSGHLLPNIKFY